MLCQIACPLHHSFVPGIGKDPGPRISFLQQTGVRIRIKKEKEPPLFQRTAFCKEQIQHLVQIGKIILQDITFRINHWINVHPAMTGSPPDIDNIAAKIVIKIYQFAVRIGGGKEIIIRE